MEHSHTVLTRKASQYCNGNEQNESQLLGSLRSEMDQFLKNGKIDIYSGGREHQRGVALILDRRLSKSILACWEKSDCLLLVKLLTLSILT